MKIEIYQLPTLSMSFLWTSSPTSALPLASSNSLFYTYQLVGKGS
jgi:hypothetical protein